MKRTLWTKNFRPHRLLLLVVVSSLAAGLQAQSTSFKLETRKTQQIATAQVECCYQYSISSFPVSEVSSESNVLIPDTTRALINEVYYTILQTTSDVSKFWDYNSFVKDSIIYSSPIELSSDSINKLWWKYNAKVQYLFAPVIWKNYPFGKITVTDEIVPNDYIYEEEKVKRQWIISEDTMTVCGYICHRATTHFGGYEWTAWYTPDIPISDGPWKLYGLPGLILCAENADKTHRFDAIAIRNSNNPIYLDKNQTQLKVKKGVFLKNKNEFEKGNPMDNIDPQTIQNISVFKNDGFMLINGKKTIPKRKSIYVPLEIE